MNKTTNAQVALMAAAESVDGGNSNSTVVIYRADLFLDWLNKNS